MHNFILVKPGLHIVITIAQHACDRVLKRVLKLSGFRLQIFLVNYEYLRSLQLCEDQGIRGKLEKPVLKMKIPLEDFKDFKAITEKQTFSPSKLVIFPSELIVLLRKPTAILFE